MKKFDINKFGTVCRDAQEYYKNFESFEDAWRECPRGDWMLWISKKLDVDLKLLTRAKALCALTVRHLMKDQRSIDACEVALKFSEGTATIDELRAATYAAAYAASDAATDAAYTSASASAATAAAAADADAAAAAADAAAAAADAAAARKQNQKATADICRGVLTEAVFEKIKHYD